jgi:4-amino-4-deoxy-L-arabinose transferase-like glycosyltransferase
LTQCYYALFCRQPKLVLMQLTQSKRPIYLLFIFTLILFFFKLPSFYLPHFWDDAWPYSAGINQMYEHGLSLLPGAVSFDVSRGHPLLFHFLFAAWMKLAGTSLFAMHMLAFILSAMLLYAVYYFCKAHFSEEAGMLSALFLIVQPLFIAQSTLVLPEMLLALFLLLALHFFLLRKYFFYVLFASCALLTKETGIVLIVTLLLSLWILHGEEPSVRQKVKVTALIFLPVLLAVWFFIIQKIKTGFFFLPLYTENENFAVNTVLKKLHDYSASFFIYSGRNMVSVSILISLAWIYFNKKNRVNSEHIKILSLLGIFIALFLLFSSLSFYSPRYLLSILPAFLIIAAYLLIHAFQKINVIAYLSGFIIMGAALMHCAQRTPVTDHSPAYTDAIEVSRLAVIHCEQNNLFDKPITTTFLLRNYLENYYCGYLSSERNFKNVNRVAEDDSYFLIRCSFENSDEINELIKTSQWELIKRFDKNFSWTEIYSRK